MKKYLAETELFAISGTKILKPFHSYKSGARPLSFRKEVFPIRNEWMKNLVIRDPGYKKEVERKVSVSNYNLRLKNLASKLFLKYILKMFLFEKTPDGCFLLS